MSQCTKPHCNNIVENTIYKRCDKCRAYVALFTKKYRDAHEDVRAKNNAYAKQYYQKKIHKVSEVLPVDEIKNI